MRTNQPDTCAIGLTPETLSQWRDRVLDAAATRAIDQHIDTCAACQHWLQSFATTAQQLRQRSVPPTGASLWRDVQQRIATAEHQRRQRLTPMWKNLSAAVAALLVGAVFAYALHNHIDTTSRPVATPTALAPITLPWQRATTPSGIGNFATLTAPSLAFTPRDSRTAYTCFPGGATGAVTEIWTTHDSGATAWQHLTSPSRAGALDGCSLVLDSTDAAIIAATIGPPGLKPHLTTRFFSLNGGQQWRPLASWTYGELQQSATVQNTTYLLGGNHLGVSHDTWQSWSLIDGAITAAGESVVHFWLDPTTHAILALGNNSQDQSGITTTGHLWQTNDGGSHWTKLALTPTFDDARVFAQPPAAGQPWQICGQHDDTTAGDVHPYTLACSLDGGHSWLQRPPVERTSAGLYVADALFLGLTHDGTLIESTGTSAGITLYRLGAGATTWQSLGAGPETNGTVTLVDDGKTAMLWAYPPALTPLSTVQYLPFFKSNQ